MQMHWDSKNSV